MTREEIIPILEMEEKAKEEAAAEAKEGEANEGREARRLSWHMPSSLGGNIASNAARVARRLLHVAQSVKVGDANVQQNVNVHSLAAYLTGNENCTQLSLFWAT